MGNYRGFVQRQHAPTCNLCCGFMGVDYFRAGLITTCTVAHQPGLRAAVCWLELMHIPELLCSPCLFNPKRQYRLMQATYCNNGNTEYVGCVSVGLCGFSLAWIHNSPHTIFFLSLSKILIGTFSFLKLCHLIHNLHLISLFHSLLKITSNICLSEGIGSQRGWFYCR